MVKEIIGLGQGSSYSLFTEIQRKMSDYDISEEEMKVWQEKQQKRDQLSHVMGEYLLKGYRMLDSYCSECNVSNNYVT